MTTFTINIADDFSDAPGARYIKDGPASGELFYERLLKPKFESAVEENSKLLVDLDGTFGYATSFISEAFGHLSRDFTSEQVLKIIIIKSEEDEAVKEFVIKTIKNPAAK
jgi:hypothetical protein